MKIKFKDLEIAFEYMKANSQAESIEIEENTSGVTCEFAFTDKNNKATRIMLYNASHSITPEIRTTTKLYKNTPILKVD